MHHLIQHQQRDVRGALYTEYLVLAGLVGLAVALTAGEIGRGAGESFIRLCLRVLGVA